MQQIAVALYATHLDDGSWTRRDVEPCARLPHHRFALFTQSPTDGAIARFFAVYNLDAVPPPRASPWQRGVQLIRLAPRTEKHSGVSLTDPHLLAVFNRALEEEHAAGPDVPPASRINIDDLADCYLAATGEQRLPSTTAPVGSLPKQTSIPVVGGPVVGIMVPLISPAGYTRTANLRLDDSGLLTKADVLVQYTAR